MMRLRWRRFWDSIRASWVLDVAISVVIIVATAIRQPFFRPKNIPFALGSQPPHQPPEMPFEQRTLLMWVLLAVCVMCIFLRRRLPLTSAILSLGVFIVFSATQMTLLGVGIGLAVVTYTVGSSRNRRDTFIWGGLATLVVTVLSFAAGRGDSLDPTIFQFAAVVAISAALGDSARANRQHLKTLTERAERAEQTREAEANRAVAEERLRIAQDLHDIVAHKISLISLNAGVASGAIASNPDKAKNSLSQIRKESRSVLADIGGLMHYLRAKDDSFGADPSRLYPLPTLAEIPELIASMSKAGLDITYGSKIAEADEAQHGSTIRSAIQAVSYRVVQEGLTNALKYGNGQANVRIDAVDGFVVINVSNGLARDPAARLASTGWGLRGLKERAQAVGGTLTTETSLARFTLTARLPLMHDSF